jgi:hypothetical protein
MKRETILTTAEQLINGDRAKDYGVAETNFNRIAALWQPILGVSITPEQVALSLAALKIARLIQSPAHIDSWVDACGYLALGGEIAQKPDLTRAAIRDEISRTMFTHEAGQ